MHLHPTPQQFAAVSAIDDDQPVVMLNLLKFAERANPGFGCDDMTGEEAFREYGRRLDALDFPAQPIWMGNGGPTVIGPDTESWDQIVLIRWDCAAEFLAAVTTPEYLEASAARDAALSDSRLVMMNELFHAPPG